MLFCFKYTVSDYSPNAMVSGLILRGHTSNCQTFTALSDNEVEGNELFQVSLSLEQLESGTGVKEITENTVVVTIVDQTTPGKNYPNAIYIRSMTSSSLFPSPLQTEQCS